MMEMNLLDRIPDPGHKKRWQKHGGYLGRENTKFDSV